VRAHELVARKYRTRSAGRNLSAVGALSQFRERGAGQQGGGRLSRLRQRIGRSPEREAARPQGASARTHRCNSGLAGLGPEPGQTSRPSGPPFARASRQCPTPSAKRYCRTWWAEVRVHSRKAVVPVFRPPPPRRPQEETAVRKCSDWWDQEHAMYPAAEIRAISTPRRRSSQSVGAIAGRECRLECRDRVAV
jgi:hypothetical protein